MTPYTLDSTLGAVFIGTVLGCILYGLIIYQAYRYIQLFPTDPPFLKGLVGSIIVFETLHTAVWIFVGYEYGITHAFDISNVSRNHWYTSLTIVIAEITGLTNPIFYARQVYFAIPRFRWVVAISMLAMLGGLAFSITATVRAFQSADLDDFVASNWIVCSAYGCTVFAEILLASTLIGWLLHSNSGFARTKSVVATLITYVVHTGLLNTIFGLLVFVFALVYPRKLIYTGISIVGIKLCSVSVLAVLNSRASLSALLVQQTTVGTTSELAFPSRPSVLPRTMSDAERHGFPQLTVTSVPSRICELSRPSSTVLSSREELHRDAARLAYQ